MMTNERTTTKNNRDAWQEKKMLIEKKAGHKTITSLIKIQNETELFGVGCMLMW